MVVVVVFLASCFCWFCGYEEPQVVKMDPGNPGYLETQFMQG